MDGQALLGLLVDDLALLGVGPVLLPALPVARHHLHLNNLLGKKLYKNAQRSQKKKLFSPKN